MKVILSETDLLSYTISGGAAYVPPRSHISVKTAEPGAGEELALATWTELTFRFDSLELEYRAIPQLLLGRFPPEIPTKKQARGKDKEAVQVKGKTVLCAELSKGVWVGFIPPGNYHSIQLTFGEGGASFLGVEMSSRSSNRIIASRNFAASAAKRTVSMVHTPNPETMRRLKKTASSFVSLLNGLKDDLIGVKPLEEIPDGPYGLEEYDIWFAKNCTIGAKEEIFADYFISTFATKPLISVILGVSDADLVHLAATVHSVIDQLYDRFELIICHSGVKSEGTLSYLSQLGRIDDRIRIVRAPETQRGIASAMNEAILASKGEYLAFVNQNDLLNRDALFWVAEKLNESPQSELIYSDEDCIDLNQHYVLPYFKPDFNLLLLTSYNYVGNLMVASASLARQVMMKDLAGHSCLYDFLLRSALKLEAGKVKHIPRILYHKRLPLGHSETTQHATPEEREQHHTLIRDFLKSWSNGAYVEGDGHSGFSRVRFQVPDPAPEVAIVIPTRDTPEVLERCVNSLVNFTKYPNFKIHIIDNQSVEARTHSLFDELKILHKAQVHSYDKPFNYSDMHNWLISKLDSELVCLLNNDTEIIEEDWLSELVSLVSLPDFGAAGSLLLYPDRSIQHAGVTLGIGGIAAHIGVGDAPDDRGYYCRNLFPQEISAVTAACLLVKRDLYLQVGGMNADQLPVSFNDVDLCLKIRSAKYKIAWTPYSRLIHHESKSRGIDHEDEFKKLRAAGEMSYCAMKWRSEIANDPYFNPNFDLKSDPYQMLASLPRLELTLKPYNKT